MAETTGRMKIGVMPSLSADSLGSGAAARTPRFRDVWEMAQMAEQVGFDSFWLADHLQTSHPDKPTSGQWEVFTILGGVAAVTRRMQFGPLVACTSFRQPTLLAKMADTLDEMSEGRFILGLGAGWHRPEYDAFGFPFDRKAARFEEALKIILPLLRDGKVDFQGEFYEARDCVLIPRGPTPKGPPIWIGASRPRMLRLVAEHADAWNTVWHHSPEGVTRAYGPMLEACQAVGRDPTTLALTAGTFARILAPGEARPEDVKGICGEAEDVAQQLRAFEDIGVKHLTVIVTPNDVRGIELFGAALDAFSKR